MLTPRVYTSSLILGRPSVQRGKRTEQNAYSGFRACYTFFMKALVITNLTGPEGLTLQDVPEAAANPPRTLVRVSAGGLNFADFMTTKGGYPGTPAPPLIAGR